MKIYRNKKVLLHERKRHTTHCVASAHYAALSNGGGGYPIQSWLWQGGTPSSPGWGYPIPGPGGGYPIIQSWLGDTPSSPGQGGTPSQVQGGIPHQLAGVPPWTWDLVPPSPSRPGMGYPLQLDGVPPPTWDGVPPPVQTWDGVPPPPHRGVNWQTKWKQYVPPSFGRGR